MPGEITVRKAEDADVSTVRNFLLKLDAHLAGVARGVLDLSAEYERQLGSRIENLINSSDHHLVIADDSNGNAVGMAASLVDIAAWQGIKELIVEYLVHNTEAERFWRQLGFAATGFALRDR